MRWTLRRGLQFLQVGDQDDHFHQQIQVCFLLCRNIYENCGTAPVFGHQAAIAQLLFYSIGQRAGFVDFIYGNNNRDFRGVRVVDSLEGLRHDAIVGGYD